MGKKAYVVEVRAKIKVESASEEAAMKRAETLFKAGRNTFQDLESEVVDSAGAGFDLDSEDASELDDDDDLPWCQRMDVS
jgi:hypothetical protein